MINKILVFSLLFFSINIKSQEIGDFCINAHLISSMTSYRHFCSYFNKHKINIDFKDDNGDTLLIHACRNGYEDIVKFLVEKKADLNIKNNDGRTALITAVRHDQTKIVKFLVECRGIDLRIKDKKSLDALGYSFKRNIESPKIGENSKEILTNALNKHCCVIL